MRRSMRDVVFGLEDGIVSSLGALIGIAEGTRSGPLVALSGFVIIAVESLSMAGGSYLSSKAHREYLQRLLREEEKAIDEDPAGERREIREMYGRRGYSRREIKMIEKRLLADRRLLLEDMAHKELGIIPGEIESPSANALAMGVSYVFGGAVPMVPYLIFDVGPAMAVSLAGSIAAILVLGAVKGKLVGRSPWLSAIEMLAVAGGAAGVGYLIGRVARTS